MAKNINLYIKSKRGEKKRKEKKRKGHLDTILLDLVIELYRKKDHDPFSLIIKM
jgi:hypothetical protein